MKWPRRAVSLRLVWLFAAALGAGSGCDRGGAARSSAQGADPGVGAATAAGAGSSARGARDPAGFLKGQLHLHSNGSGDSRTPPDEVAAWYAAHAYDFIVFTDHNKITDTVDPAGMLTLPGVELTQNLRICDPPPGPDHACLLHVNALFVAAAPVWGSEASDAARGSFSWIPPRSAEIERRSVIYGRAVAAAQELGGIAQLNHPDFHFAADASILIDLAARGLALVEIANQAVDSTNEGDTTHPSTEALWDEALSRGAILYGTATDDAHHYNDADAARARGETAYVGDLGFVMVRAEKTPGAIRGAIARGDFYSSTGVLLDNLILKEDKIEVDVRGAPEALEIEVIGKGGVVLSKSRGSRLRFDPKSAPPGYVRVRVTDSGGRKAWTQPVFTK